MNLLAIETSSSLCSVALLAGKKLVQAEIEAGQEHSSLVLPMVARVLHAGGIGLAQVEGIAFGAGPGSFTGLRIACGIAQGLAAGAGLQVAGISTLEALAEDAWQTAHAHYARVERVVACIDARMNEVYHAAYERAGEGWQVCSAPGLYAPDKIPSMQGGGWVGAGSGFAAFGDRLRARQALVAEFRLMLPRASIVAALAVSRFAAGETTPAAEALPIYLRDKVALTTSERAHERHTAS